MGAAEALGGSTHDRLKNTLDVLVELIIPDAEDCPSLLLKEAVAGLISHRPGMLAAVEFDNQSGLPAGEIRKVWTDRQLARELRPYPRQNAPQSPLVLRRTVSQHAGTLRLIVWNTTTHRPDLNSLERFAHPPLAPPFQGGEAHDAGPCAPSIRTPSFQSRAQPPNLGPHS